MQPRFRQDLVAETVEDHGAKFIDVMDPDSGNLFRFYEAEFSLACGMDGERDIAALVKWARDELGLTASPGEIQAVIATLGELGYLDSGEAAADVPLSPGVVVANPAAAPSVGDVALGRAGSNARAGGPLPRAPELELGAAGTSGATRPRGPVEDITLGAPGASAKSSATTSDVSLDLSDHIAVKPADVKEAVRQSKVMSAVDVPRDLLDPSMEPSSMRPPERMPRPPVTPIPRTPAPKPIETAPAPTPTPTATPAAKPAERKKSTTQKPVVELPSVPDKQPIAPPAPRRGVSPVLLVLLILVIAGGAGFAVWKYIIDRTNEPDTTSSAQQPVPPPAPTPPPLPPKQYAKGKIAMQSPGPKTVLSVFGGSVEWIEAKDKPVKSGDIVMRLGGHKQLEATIATLQKDVDKRRADVEALTKVRDDAAAANKPAEAKAAQAKLDDREQVLSQKDQLLSGKRDSLEELVVRVNRDGVFTPTAKVGQKVPENTPVATLQADPEPAVTFEIPQDLKLDTNATIPLERVGEQASKELLTCTVSEWAPRSLRVICPGVPDLAEGTEVRWELP